MKSLAILVTLATLCLALETAGFDARDVPNKSETFGKPTANRVQQNYYLDETGKDSIINCGTVSNDVPCQTYTAAKAQFFKKPTVPVEPKIEDYGGEDDPIYINAQNAYAAAVARYPTDLAASQSPVTITVGSSQYPTFDHPYEIDDHRTIIIQSSYTPIVIDRYQLVLIDKSNPDVPLIEVKSGSIQLTNVEIIHYESTASSDKGIIDFSSVNKEDNDLTGLLTISYVTFSQKDWRVTQTKPFVTFSSETASFSITSSTFNKAKISTDGIVVLNGVEFGFSSNNFYNISGVAGTEALIHATNIKGTTEDQGYITIGSNNFVGIGCDGAVKNVLLIEVANAVSIPNIHALKLTDNNFIENIATNSGGFELVGSSFNLHSSSNLFYNNIGQLASDILVTGENLDIFTYKFDNTRSTLKTPESVSVKIGEIDISSSFVNSETTFTVSDGSDASSVDTTATTTYYFTIGEALFKAKLGKLDEEILIDLNPGKHTRDGYPTDRTQLEIGKYEHIISGLYIYYPQKVAIVGSSTRPVIERSSSNAFALTVSNQGQLRLNNLHVTSNGVSVTSAFVTSSGEKLTIDDVEFVNNNLGTSYSLVSLSSFTDASITNCIFRNSNAQVLIFASLQSSYAKLIVQGNTFDNDEFQSSYKLSDSAVYIASSTTGVTKISSNTFKYLKVGSNYAPIYIYGISSTTQIKHNTFEDNTGGTARAVRIYGSVITGQIGNFVYSNTVIKAKDTSAYKAAYTVGSTDYSYLIPEYINRRYVVKGEAPAGTIPEEVFASLPEAIEAIPNRGTAKLYINIIGGTELHETSTIDKPLLNLEIVGVEHREDKLAKKEDQPQFKYEEVLRVQLSITGSFNVGDYRSLDLRDLNITYLGPQTEFLINAKEGSILTVKNAIIDVPEISDKDVIEGYLGYVKLDKDTKASFTNVIFGALKLKDPLGEFNTGAAIVGRNILGLALTDSVFKDIVINNDSLALSVVRVGTSPTSSRAVSISNSIFEQSDKKKNNKNNKNPFDKEFKTPAVYIWTELRDDGTPATSGNRAVLSINNTKFTHCRGGAVRIRDIRVNIDASSRFSKNLPRFKNFKTFEANIQVEGSSILQAEEESFVKEGTKDKNSYSWILPCGDKATFSGSIAKNSGVRLFTLPVLSKASGKYDATILGAIVTLKGKRFYPTGDLKAEIYEEGKEDDAVALGMGQLYLNEKYTHKESRLYIIFPLDVEEDKKKAWRVRLIYGLGKKTDTVKLKIK